jgi:hypothetical protein
MQTRSVKELCGLQPYQETPKTDWQAVGGLWSLHHCNCLATARMTDM